MPPKPKSVTTRSKASKQQCEAISTASRSSPPKGTRSKKSLQSPAATGTTPQVVTATKQAKSSNSIAMTSAFDPKLEHLMINYFMALGDQHNIRQAFIQNQITDFETFIGSCNMDFLRDMQLTKNNTTGDALNKAKLKLVNDVLLYYEFFYQDKECAKADEPTQWIRQDFKIWKSRGYHVSTAAYNESLAVNTNAGAATVTTTATAAAVKQKEQKEEDDSFLSWRRSRKEEKDYPVLNNDREFIEWKVKFERKIHSDEMYRMIDPGFHIASLHTGSDKELHQKQKNFFTTILEYVRQTKEGKRLTRKYPDDPRQVWNLHEKHPKSSATAWSICTGLSQELAKLKIVEYNNPTEGLDTFDSYLTKYNQISPTAMPNNLAIMYLEAATSRNSDLLSAWTQQ